MKIIKSLFGSLACFLLSLNAQAYDTLKVKYYEVGPGSCVLVQCPGDQDVNLLIDCGSHRVTQKDRVLSDLITTANNKKTHVILTHSDKDHHNWVEDIFYTWTLNGNSLPIGDVYMGDKWSKYKQPTPSVLQLKTKEAATHIYGRMNLSDNSNPVIAEARITKRSRHGDTLTYDYNSVSRLDIPGFASNSPTPNNLGICGDADVFILGGNADSQQFGNKTNPQSLVVGLSWQGRDFIFPGDATNGSTDKALEKALRRWFKVNGQTIPGSFTSYNSELSVDVMMAPHHGSDVEGSAWNGWAKVTQPDYLIFSGDPSVSNKSLRHPTIASYNAYAQTLKAYNDHDLQVKQPDAKTYHVTQSNNGKTRRLAYTNHHTISNAAFGLHDVSDVTVEVFPAQGDETQGHMEVSCLRGVCSSNYFYSN